MDKHIKPLLAFIYNLSSTEITIIVVVTVFLVFVLLLRKFGIKLALAFLFLCMFGYVLYANDFLGKYKEQKATNIKREREIREEIEKM